MITYLIGVSAVVLWILAARPHRETPAPRRRWTRIEVDGQYRHVWLDEDDEPCGYCSGAPWGGR